MTDLGTRIHEESVRDCLAHLYDYAFLQDHPLVRLLVPQAQGGASRIQVFQELILSAIERLKPHDPGNLQTKNSRLYGILSLRYQHQQTVQYVLKQLNLGERQFYRDYAKAVQALTRILEELSSEDLASDESVNITDTTSTMYAELKRAQRQNVSTLINAEVFFQNILVAVKGLSQRQCAEVGVQCLETMLPGNLDQTCLRQVIIWITSHLLTQSSTGSRFLITFDTEANTARVKFSWQSDQPLVGLEPLFEERHKTLETLLTTLGACIYDGSDHGQNAAIVLEIPIQQHTVLIIDDNPDVISLFRRYLSGQSYQIFTAYDGVQAISLAREMRPTLIILDVLMPEQDGWDILRHLKNHPTTLGTPIVICSVLDVSDLAVMLGADGFLLKPPPENEFLNTLKRFLN